MVKFKRFLLEFIVTFGWVGRLPWMPGTFGSLAGLLIAIPLTYCQPTCQLIAIGVLFGVAVLACHFYQKLTGAHDASYIVIDEVVGMCIAMLAVPGDWFGCLLAFGFFRFFDIIKPFPISWADRNIKGGLGVVFDDVLAGIVANLLVHLARGWQ